MPELPEVETLRKDLAKVIKGKTIKSAKVKWPNMVKPLTPVKFQNNVRNKKITDVYLEISEVGIERSSENNLE